MEGQHAASIGKVDGGLLFYLNSRGIPEKQARYLLAQARLNTVLQHVPDEALARRVREALAERMATL